MGINDWPGDDRPREKLLKNGAQALSTAELLAISLRTGRQGESAVDLARFLLTRFNGLQGLFAATDDELLRIPGLGPAKIAQIRAVIKLAGRYLVEEAKESPILCNPDTIFKIFKCTISDPGCEEFWVLILDEQNKLIEIVSLFRGSLKTSRVYPREVVKVALRHQAAKLILAHNHPSGDHAPSDEDKAITRRLIIACHAVDIEVLDHIIIGSNDYFSFAQHGLILNRGRS